MNSQPPKLLVRIIRLPVIGDLLCCFAYVFLKLTTPLLWLPGFRPIKLGTSVIWTPQNKRQPILDGIECLRTRDMEMYLCLTKKQKLVFYYSNSERVVNLLGYYFGLSEKCIKLGSECIACFIVQSLLHSDASPSINQHRKNDMTRAALKAVPRKTVEWMQQHSFNSDFVNSYLKVIEKWEEKNRLQ
ncbi:MAG: hypothetical protein ABSG87_02595 [Verrucomicrobiota bacterium]|jgi:hypothetical protein